ncbi:MAG TPA: hypothetical protein VF669_02720 [Tepidisphaeraceae bacterium]|jgi:transcription elongation factor Elf1
MDAFYAFLVLALMVACAAWFLLALHGDRRQKRKHYAEATALGSKLVCPTCNLPTLQWSQDTWEAELQYLDGTTKTERGFTYICVNCSQLHDFTTEGAYRRPVD